jgi:hypothetical protein
MSLAGSAVVYEVAGCAMRYELDCEHNIPPVLSDLATGAILTRIRVYDATHMLCGGGVSFRVTVDWIEVRWAVGSFKLNFGSAASSRLRNNLLSRQSSASQDPRLPSPLKNSNWFGGSGYPKTDFATSTPFSESPKGS